MIAPLAAALALCTPAWHAVPGVPSSAGLRAVAASSPADVWAAGANLVEHWDGSRWSAVADAAPAGATVGGLAARARDDAWLVGASGTTPLIEHWDGVGWSLAAPTGATGSLAAVSADGRSDAWAVGSNLVLHWDGSAWSAAGPPLRPNVRLFDVDAARPTDVWAAGEDGEHGTGIALHWDGARWTVFHPYAPTGTEVTFLDVARDPAGGIVAVGYAYPSPDVDELMGDVWGVIYRYDGRHWSRRIPDGAGTFISYDAAVAMGAQMLVVANDGDPMHQQDGSALFTTAHPTRRTKLAKGHVLAALAFDGTSVWGVGWIGSGFAHPDIDYDYKTFRPLIMRYGCA